MIYLKTILWIFVGFLLGTLTEVRPKEQPMLRVQPGNSACQFDEFSRSPAIYERNIQQKEASHPQPTLIVSPNFLIFNYLPIRPVEDRSKVLFVQIEQDSLRETSAAIRKLRF